MKLNHYQNLKMFLIHFMSLSSQRIQQHIIKMAVKSKYEFALFN